MREWRLTSHDPMAPRISADARAGHTVFNDDQTWQLRLGDPQEPAVSLETRYGGRLGLARLVPVWFVGRRQVYESQGYHSPPVLAAFAPDYLRLRAALTLSLDLTIEFWAMESQAVGGRFTLTNTADSGQEVMVGLVAQSVREESELQKFFLTLETGEVALQTFRLPQFQPVLVLEGAEQQPATKARLTRPLSIGPGESVAVRWVLGSLDLRDDSLRLAFKWLADDWTPHLDAIERRAAAAPQISTGHADWDAALVWSQHTILRSFLGATGSLPYPSFVRSRKTTQGFAVSGVHASGFGAPWGGQTIPDALGIAMAVALAAPDLAKGIVRNFLAVQREDGWIDARPGLDGQRAQVLAPPMLAALAYTVYQVTQDRDFLAEVFEGALGLFDRWFKPDTDRNGDGLPEWQHPDQGTFADSPTLAQNRRWAEGVDITTIQMPDLAAILIREARTLLKIAEVLGEAHIAAQITPRLDVLRERLADLWDDERGMFTVQDRETHTCPTGDVVYAAKGDQPLNDRIDLPQASRLILRILGGLSRKPKTACVIEGIDADGNATHEDLTEDTFSWYRGQGAATTRKVWRAITYLKFDGLSRVFSIEARTPDLTRPDMSHLIPLWSGALDDDQEKALVAQITDPAKYGRAYGIPGCPADDPAYDPQHRNGCGGMWPDWNARIAWGLIDQGYVTEAADLFKRVLAAQIKSLQADQCFRRLYDPDTGAGLGDADDLAGVVSLDWFQRLFGAYVLDPGTAVIHDPFGLAGESVAWTQHGATITRGDAGTVIEFASGHCVELAPDAKPQIVRDPGYKPAKPRKPAPEADAAPDAEAGDAPGVDGEQMLPPDDGLLPDGV